MNHWRAKRSTFSKLFLQIFNTATWKISPQNVNIEARLFPKHSVYIIFSSNIFSDRIKTGSRLIPSIARWPARIDNDNNSKSTKEVDVRPLCVGPIVVCRRDDFWLMSAFLYLFIYFVFDSQIFHEGPASRLRMNNFRASTFSRLLIEFRFNSGKFDWKTRNYTVVTIFVYVSIIVC